MSSLGNQEKSTGRMSPVAPATHKLTSLRLKSITVPLPTPGPNEVVVRILCAALNHRDLFARQKLYRGAAGNIPILADGCGIVVSAGSSDNEKKWQGKRVLIAPARGWNADLRGPEREFAILGGTKQYPDGTCQEFICVPSSQVLACPPHLSDAEAAAVPLAALTAWRATMVKAVVSSGQRVLVTGIGGGVALFALQFAVAAGAEVWVTSGSAEKIARAVELGAKGGVSYKEKDWAQKLLKHTSKGGKSGLFDAVIDGAGGDVITAAVVLLRTGGIVASYGMTVGPKVVFPMPAVMKNIEVRLFLCFLLLLPCRIFIKTLPMLTTFPLTDAWLHNGLTRRTGRCRTLYFFETYRTRG